MKAYLCTQPQIAVRLLGLVVLLAFGGCDGADYSIVPVCGTVTLNGRPLAGARISFEPQRRRKQIDAGPGSYGTTDAEGHFELVSLDGRAGAVVGVHHVSIRTRNVKAGASGEEVVIHEEMLPARYHDTSALTFAVPPEGTSHADFALESSAGR